MVKKFFRKLIGGKKNDQTDESVEGQSSDKIQNENTQEYFEQDNDANDTDDHFQSELPPIEDLDDLPDLPPEVLKALKSEQIKESDLEMSPIKDINFDGIEEIQEEIDEEDEEEEEFNFTEIKSSASVNDEKTRFKSINRANLNILLNEQNEHDGQDNQTSIETDESSSDDSFQFSELKVDLPTENKLPFLHSFLNNIQNLLNNLQGLGKTKNDLEDEQLNGILFSVKAKTNFHQIFVTLTIFFASYQTGNVIANLLKSPIKSKTTSLVSSAKSNNKNNQATDLVSLEKLNPFDAKITAKKDTPTNSPKKKVVIDETKVCETSTKKSNLPINIDSIIVLQDRVKSIASVQLRSKKDIYIREGDKLDALALVGSIQLDKVIVRNLENGNCEYLSAPIDKQKDSKTFSKVKIHPPSKKAELMPKDPNITVEGNSFKINSKIRDELLDNITDILGQARAIQIKNSDGSLAFKIVEITPGSIYSKLNIQENDVITKINGEKIENLNEVMSLFGRIKDLKNLELGIERDGIENDFQYSFE